MNKCYVICRTFIIEVFSASKGEKGIGTLTDRPQRPPAPTQTYEYTSLPTSIEPSAESREEEEGRMKGKGKGTQREEGENVNFVGDDKKIEEHVS